MEQTTDDFTDTNEMAREDVQILRSTALYTRNVSQSHKILLESEVIAHSSRAGDFRQVQRHINELEQWHIKHTGWRVQRTPQFFRLERHPYGLIQTHNQSQFKRARDFACLTWVLWFAEKRYLTGSGRNQQFLLSQLAEEIQEQSRLVAKDHQLDFRNHLDRNSIWRALEYLTRLGGIEVLEGDARRWVDDAEQEDSEVLYEFSGITHSLVEALHETQINALTTRLNELAGQLQPARINTLAEPLPLLNRVWRSLLLGPVFLRYDDPEAFEALSQHADEIGNELAETFSWLLELNNDYACIVQGGTMSAGSGPALSTTSAQDQIILLLCSAIRLQVEAGTWIPDSYGCLHITYGEIKHLFADLRQHYGTYWGAQVQQTKATDLLHEIFTKMRLHGLLRGPDEDDNLLILPTAARYAAHYSQEAIEASNQARARTGTKSRKASPKKTAGTKQIQTALDWSEQDSAKVAKESD